MAIGEPRGAGSSPPRAKEPEPAYEGVPGQTHLRSLHLPLPNGFVRTVQVYDTVNVGTDPHLREATLSGVLHRFDTGEELAIPFVYHDPNARKFALVVPEVLRHEELSLRAKLLGELAAHTSAPVPNYVREATVVVGVSELQGYLKTSASNGSLAEVAQRESLLAQREASLEQRLQDYEIQFDSLVQRESRLHQRAEQITRREDELRAYAEELEAAQADLAIREQELESRLEMLRQREVDLSSRARAASPGSDRIGDADVVQLVDDEVEEVEEIEGLEPLDTSPGKVVADLSDEVQLVGEPQPLEDDVEEIVDDLEELEDVTGVHAEVPSRPPTAPLGPSQSAEDTEAPFRRSEAPPHSRSRARGAEGSANPAAASPAEFLEERHGPSARVTLEEGGVRIFARAPEGRDDLFTGANPELLAQLVVIEECPVVLLTLVDPGLNGPPTAVRAALDPRSPGDRAILECLRETFEARVDVFGAAGTRLHALDVKGPREANVARILDRVTKMRTASAVDVSTAIERVLSAPPPVTEEDHPFGPSARTEKPARAVEAAARLEKLAEWSSHEKMDHALLVLSLPPEQVDATLRAVIGDAIAHGLPLPGRLPERAVLLGIAPDEAALVSRQIEAFTRTTNLADRGGLTAEAVAEAWESLLQKAAETELSIDAETHELAWAAIRAVRGGDGMAEIDPEKLPDMPVPEVVGLLDHPRYRCQAATELIGRNDPELAEQLCQAARKMPRGEVLRVLPRMVNLGDAAGDALIDGLGARKTFVRQAFALTLGELKLRRAVVPLVHLLASEQSEIWREVARIIGTFGTASMRNVTRQLKDPKGLEERYVLAMAHLANHGCEKQVKKLASDDRPEIAKLASEALARRSEARSVEDQVRGRAPLGADDAILEFSRRFYQEVEGSAPDFEWEEGDRET